jgi:hypothetical protein
LFASALSARARFIRPAIFANFGFVLVKFLMLNSYAAFFIVTLGALLSGIAWYTSATALPTKHFLVWHVAIVAQRPIQKKTNENQ